MCVCALWPYHNICDCFQYECFTANRSLSNRHATRQDRFGPLPKLSVCWTEKTVRVGKRPVIGTGKLRCSGLLFTVSPNLIGLAIDFTAQRPRIQLEAHLLNLLSGICAKLHRCSISASMHVRVWRVLMGELSIRREAQLDLQPVRH